MPVDTKAALTLLEELRALSGDEHGAQRLAWSPMWLKAREWFLSKLADLPVEHHYDAAGTDSALRERLEVVRAVGTDPALQIRKIVSYLRSGGVET